jgi:hypothetical protein
MIEYKLRSKLGMLLLATSLGAVTASAQSALAEASEVEIGGKRLLAGILMVQLRPGVDVWDPQAALPEGFEVVGQLLPPNKSVLYGAWTRRFIGSNSQALYIAEDKLMRSVIVRYAGPIMPQQAIQRLLKDQDVVFAEPYYVAQVQGATNDPEFSSQTALATMRLAQAWDIEDGDPGLVIGISDNGVDQTHEDLNGSLWTNALEIPNNNIDDDNNGAIDDYQGYNFTWQEDGTSPGDTRNNRSNAHGTRVAGIAGATWNNATGMAGVGGRCKIFPMKTARITTGGVIYGYQSLIYAAQQGFDVTNCSWGVVKPFSPIDQAVIDYCLANNMVVTASAGNHGSGASGDGWNELNYPSAYDGVIGVGETTVSDIVESSSGLGLNSMVMAPGNDALATIPGNGYTTSGNTGTSFAAPMAAGLAALVRVRHSALNPRQVAALLRRTAVDISNKNQQIAPYVSGRIDAVQALTTDPSSISAVRIVNASWTRTDGSPADRYAVGDTLNVTYQLANDLAATGAMTYTLRVLDANNWNVQFLTDMTTSASITSGRDVMVGPFTLVIKQYTETPCLLELQMQDDGSYDDRALDRLMPPPAMTTMENQALVYSVGDDGTFGFSSSLVTRQGIGFNWKPEFVLISPSGFILSEGGDRALMAYNNLTNISDFTAEKSFVAPDPELGIMTDANVGTSREIGVRVTQRFTFPSTDARSTVISIDVENRSSSTLNDLAAGYFFDWDVGNAGASNKTRLAPEALPTSFRELGLAQLFERDDVDAVVVCAAVSSELSFEPQAAGMLLDQYVDDNDGLTDADVITLLSSNASIQTFEVGDACGVLGMRFPGTIAPNERRSFMIVIGVGATVEEASEIVRETIERPNNVDEVRDVIMTIAPNPAQSTIDVQLTSSARSWSIIDLTGSRVASGVLDGSQTRFTVDVAALAQGMYTFVIETQTGLSAHHLHVVR